MGQKELHDRSALHVASLALYGKELARDATSATGTLRLSRRTAGLETKRIELLTDGTVRMPGMRVGPREVLVASMSFAVTNIYLEYYRCTRHSSETLPP